MILRVAVPTPLRTLFDYSIPEVLSLKNIQVGARVRVPFRKHEEIGCVIEIAEHSNLESSRIKPILDCLDNEPLLQEDLLQLIKFAAEYYHHPIGDILVNALPDPLRKGKALLIPKTISPTKNLNPADSMDKFVFNAHQLQAIDEILSLREKFNTFLLQGVTGSGKTEVYLKIIQQIVAEGKQALVLIPEIGLTPQTLQRFQAYLDCKIVAYHSGLSPKKKLAAYSELYYQEARVVIGTRSALFLPLPELGVIVVDEEHDPSFKQQDGFRYHARDLAIKRASLKNIPVILGTATPSLESYFKAENNHYRKIKLPERAIQKQATMLSIVDMRNEKTEDGLSQSLLDAMQRHLEQNMQVLLFLNRRGFAPVLICFNCNFQVTCANCSARMVYHQKFKRLICHHCGASKHTKEICPQCQQSTLSMIGLGTERLESALQKYFPEVEIIRLDRDSTSRRGSLEESLQKIRMGQKQILIGTQMIAKGHDLPNLTFVGIVDIDGGFLSSDFRAPERTGQLLIQVAGRAGRHHFPGEVMLQTHLPDHPLLRVVLEEGYDALAKSLIEQRELLSLPPCRHAALIRAESLSLQDSQKLLQNAKTYLKGSLPISSLEIWGPAPALMEKKMNRHRQQLLLLSEQRGNIKHCIKALISHIEKQAIPRSTRWSIDIDPVDLY